MIERLTLKRLKQIGLSKELIEKIKVSKESETPFSYEGQTYLAVLSEKKLYSGIDAYRKHYLGNKKALKFPVDCPVLCDEYYNLFQFLYCESYFKRFTLSAKYERDEINQKFIVYHLKEMQQELNAIKFNSFTNNEIYKKVNKEREMYLLPPLNPIETYVSYISFLRSKLKNKYGEPTKNITIEIPKYKEREIMNYISQKLKEYLI